MHLGRKIAVGEIIEDTGVEDTGYEELPAGPERTAEIVMRDEERVEALARR
ncbi:MAG: hypothetical protein ACRDRH_12690 [Pseudonocardia sp.]